MRVLAGLALALAVSSTAAGAQGLKDFDRPALWTGAYLGAHAGYGWGDASVTDTTGGVDPGPFKYAPRGAFGGGTAGVNWQIGALVIGIEGDLGYMDPSSKPGVAPSSNPIYHQDLTLDGGLYATATGRIGLAWDRTLFYGKGGWGYFGGEAKQTTTKPGYQTTGTSAFSGAVYGGGIEHFVTPKISVKAEYLRFNFGKEGGKQTSITDDPIGYEYLNSTKLTIDTIKVGVAVHW